MQATRGVRTGGRACVLGLLMLIVLSASGCADYLRRKALEDVAKGWCETIRASQVIPVYPLTEDLRPGDVFLVQTAIADEASRYKAKGFLPLDDFRGRLPLTASAFKQQYFNGYWEDVFFKNGANPRPSRTPGPYPTKPVSKPADKPATPGGDAATAAATKEPDTVPEGANTTEALLSQANAPRAVFPSYTFNVSASSGLGLAVPIQSIPVGLSVLRAQSATGSVTIADARTYAADPQAVYKSLKLWARDSDVQEQLKAAARTAQYPVYLRVVTRVYMTGAVNVALQRKSAFASDLSGGKAPEINLINSDGTVNEKNKAAMKELNGENSGAVDSKDTGASGGASSSTATQPPASTEQPKTGSQKFDWAEAGVRFKFQSLSSSTVSMAEMFDTLLVVGYLGFDAPVFRDGSIGSPLPTFLRLERLVASPNEIRAAEGRYLQQTMLLLKHRDCPSADRTQQIQLAKIVAGVSARVDPVAFKDSKAAADALLAKLVPARKPAAQESTPEPVPSDQITAMMKAFLREANAFVSADAPAEQTIRKDRFIEAFDGEFDLSRVKAPKGG